jgi:hypothetical protein
MSQMERQMSGSGRRRSRPAQKKGSEMKHITGTALRAVACLVLLITGVAVLAGKDDIRKFRRMRSM